MKPRLLGRNIDELSQIAKDVGLPAFTGKQLAEWLYQKKVVSFDQMTNISKSGREKLSANYDVGRNKYINCQTSLDGTKKYLFNVNCTHISGLNAIEYINNHYIEESAIEAVMIPDGDRKTLCVSSQAGCKMGCKFCMTGRQGFHGQLSAADIINQYLSVDEGDMLTNTVFMGMGEPLDNYENVKRTIDILTAPWGFGWSPKRITLSTVGILPNLKKYLDETKCHIAISMHNPFSSERGELMPVESAYTIDQVVALLKQYDFTGQRRVSFEYTMFNGVNDDKHYADAIVRMLKGIECRVNLIRFHQIPDFPYITSSDIKMEMFRDRLNKGGVTATIRASKGEDIFAACGMLAGKTKKR